MPDMPGCDECAPREQPGMVTAQALQVRCPNPLGKKWISFKSVFYFVLEEAVRFFLRCVVLFLFLIL